MEDHKILEELLMAIESAGIKVRMEAVEESKGGLCKINGKKVLFLNSAAPAEDSAVIAAQVLSEEADLDAMFIKPVIRAFIENNSSSS